MPANTLFGGSFTSQPAAEMAGIAQAGDADALLDTPASTVFEGGFSGETAVEQDDSTTIVTADDQADFSALEESTSETPLTETKDVSEFSESLAIPGMAGTSDEALSELFNERSETSGGDVDAGLVAEAGMAEDIISDAGAFDGFENIADETSGGDVDTSMVGETAMAEDIISDAGAFDGFEGVAVDESGSVTAAASTGEATSEASSPSNAEASAPAPSQPARSSRPDQLIIIEGVGPKITTILTAAGFTTFAQLADADVEHLNTILRDAGITTANPSTWPQQARLAAEGKMDELKQLQSQIKNGRLQG